MKGLVLYKSKYGATKKYAEWIAEELDADFCDMAKFKVSHMLNYDTVILGSGIYAGSCEAFKYMKKYALALGGKNVFIFAVGMSPESRKIVAELRIRYLTRAFERLPVFYFRGAWGNAPLNIKDQVIYKLLRKALSRKNPNEYSDLEKALVESEGLEQNWIRRENVGKLIDAVKEGKKADLNY